jgi:hypothetical protein
MPLFAAILLAGAAPAASAQSRTAFGVEVQYGPARGPARDGYNRGYSEGLRRGDFDARRGLALDFERDPIFRDGMRGYEPRFGSRDFYRDDFRHGFIDGYRSSYARLRPAPLPLRPAPAPSRPAVPAPAPFLQRSPSTPGVFGAPLPRPSGYQEPAYARGYSEGYRQGADDGRDRDRYDPVGHRDYRDANDGYYGGYGSADAYRNNYRAGFRAGYEQGYRSGTGRR